MKNLWRAIEVAAAGAAAAKLLHLDPQPTVLMVIIGIACLALFLVQGALLWDGLAPERARKRDGRPDPFQARMAALTSTTKERA